MMSHLLPLRANVISARRLAIGQRVMRRRDGKLGCIHAFDMHCAVVVFDDGAHARVLTFELEAVTC